MNQEPTNTMDNNELNIDIKQLLNTVLAYKWKILFSSFLCGILGAVISLTMVNEYTSTVKILPEIDAKQSGGLNGLRSLAGLAGLDISNNSSTEAIRPDLYPNIVQSTPFLLSALEKKIFVAKKNKWIVVKDLFDKEKIEAPISFGSEEEEEEEEVDELNLKNIPKQALDKDIVNIDKKINKKILTIKEKINAEIDKKTGIITISVKMPDPIVAATLATYAQIYLTEYVTKYRTQKAKFELNFLAKRKSEAKDQYNKALFNLSSYRDQNRNLFLNVARDQERKLQYEVDIAYNLYSNLSTQLEDAKIKVQKEMPVIKILEPAQVPVKKSAPSRALITLGSIFLGFILSLGFVFVKSQKLF